MQKLEQKATGFDPEIRIDTSRFKISETGEVIPKSVYEDVSKDASEILDTIHLN